MTHIEKITTGFLSGNLFADDGYDEAASADNYASLLHSALVATYPGVAIEVVFQRSQRCHATRLQDARVFCGGRARLARRSPGARARRCDHGRRL